MLFHRKDIPTIPNDNQFYLQMKEYKHSHKNKDIGSAFGVFVEIQHGCVLQGIYFAFSQFQIGREGKVLADVGVLEAS